MLTIEDIHNPGRISGYRQVTFIPGANDHGRRAGKPFRAYAGRGRRGDWKGPRRATAEEAAQDYCDYVNGSGASLAPRVKSAGHGSKRKRLSDDPEVAAALGVLRDAKGQRQGKQGYVYCIAEAEGLSPLVKIGYSTNPQARLAELQTGNGRLLFLMGYFAGTLDDERRLHHKYIGDNTLQEWFRPSDELLSEFGFDLYDLYEKGTQALA